jgi:hypothetical protein
VLSYGVSAPLCDPISDRVPINRATHQEAAVHEAIEAYADIQSRTLRPLAPAPLSCLRSKSPSVRTINVAPNVFAQFMPIFLPISQATRPHFPKRNGFGVTHKHLSSCHNCIAVWHQQQRSALQQKGVFGEALVLSTMRSIVFAILILGPVSVFAQHSHHPSLRRTRNF